MDSDPELVSVSLTLLLNGGRANGKKKLGQKKSSELVAAKAT